MHKANIDTLRNEAKRQLQLLKELLQSAQQKGLVESPDQDEHSRATFDSDSLPKVLEVLDGESYKLEHLDMVLAVVGTMKAGKSTSINAIVGFEVLPNRNRPMTALPTLIRHTPGALKPRLLLKKAKPLNELLVQLNKTIKSKSINREVFEEQQHNADMAELLSQIQQNEPFSDQYDGDEKIFNFLKGLNDLVRLCSALHVDFPFGAYATVDSMPVIEVEFSHLKNTPAIQGRLTLLDTPGPNEAGQQHLRHMLKDQLKKASAVLAVLDYNQLKSDADAQVRENLMEIADTVKDRIYALVNRFDDKDKNSDDEAATKQYVAQTLMKGMIAVDNVFPVSAKQFYHASRARHEIEFHGKLPIGERWVDDFGKLARGASWDAEDAEDAVEMKKAADRLWKKSGFALPLEQVIVAAHQNAALEALRSATSKLDRISKDAGDFFKANVVALKKSATDLQKNINNLQQDIKNIANIEDATQKTLVDSLKKMQKNVEVATSNVQEEIRAKLNNYFKEGKRIESGNQSKKSNTKKTRRKKEPEPESSGFFFSRLTALLSGASFQNSDSSESIEKDFDPSSLIIKFDEN